MKATNVKLSNETIGAISTWSNKSLTTDKAKIKAIDSLFADGVTSDMLKAPGKDEPRVLYETVSVSIVAGFSTAIQALLKKDTKSLSEDQKKDKRYWQQQIGSKLKDLRNALAKREAKAKAEMEGSDGAQEDKSTWEATVRKELAARIAQAQKKEGTTIKDLSAFIKDLQSALARIPANA
jgi:hypothetical protein